MLNILDEDYDEVTAETSSVVEQREALLEKYRYLETMVRESEMRTEGLELAEENNTVDENCGEICDDGSCSESEDDGW